MCFKNISNDIQSIWFLTWRMFSIRSKEWKAEMVPIKPSRPFWVNGEDLISMQNSIRKKNNPMFDIYILTTLWLSNEHFDVFVLKVKMIIYPVKPLHSSKYPMIWGQCLSHLERCFPNVSEIWGLSYWICDWLDQLSDKKYIFFIDLGID